MTQVDEDEATKFWEGVGWEGGDAHRFGHRTAGHGKRDRCAVIGASNHIAIVVQHVVQLVAVPGLDLNPGEGGGGQADG